MNLAFLLKDWRDAHGFSQPQAARVIGCSRESISEWECGNPVASKFRATVIRCMHLRSDDPLIVRVKADALPPVDATQLADALRAWRRTHRLTRAQAGRAIRIHERTVFAWESRLQFPQPALLRRALAVLAAPPVGDLGENGHLARCRAQRDPSCSFGTQLRAWRKARRMNQLAACIALGLPRDQALISKWEKGKTLPRPARLAEIRAAICNP